jgi:uncharacterized protein YbaA (DUF1428 family)
MTYVDGYVLPIPKSKIKAYKKMALDSGKIWKKHGALGYFECVADDLTSVKKWKGREFSKMVKNKPSETIIFAFIIFKSKSQRNHINKKVHEEMMRTKDKWENIPMPFDMKKMAYGGFKAIVEY